MRKTLYTLFVMFLAATWAMAADAPTISSGDDVTWYYLQFKNGDNVLAAQGDGEQVKTAVPTGKSSQLWKVEGSASTGYSFTSKNGLKLYVNSAAKNGLFYAASAPTSNTAFVWSASTATGYTDCWVLSPKTSKSVYMNQWGGAGTGKALGLWDNKSDANNPFVFVSEETFNAEGGKLPLIPYPKSLTRGEGRLSLSSLTTIVAPDAPSQHYATEFAEHLKAVSGINLSVASSAASSAVTMTVDASLAHEAYTLSVTAEGVNITAADSTGFFYAIQTIKQLLPNAIYGTEPALKADWSLPIVEINDAPNLSHRGFMLDIARHYFSKAEVKRILNIMASYKMNRFHWHLTDDQGWRIEIPEYPKLTEIGSVRAGSFVNAGGATSFFDDTEYGQGYWYSLDDLREVVQYAKDRNIEIIPEIDLPGHMVAAVASYPELSCDPTKTYQVRINGGISQDVLNIGKDETIDFLKCVLGHVAEVFPYKYIHLGGDECPTGQWSNNADCLKRVQDEGLSGVSELQSWLVEQLGTWLKSTYDKDIVVWDELLTHWSSDNTVKPVIMAWNNISKSSDAADKGFKSIIVPYQTLYLDMYQVATANRDICEGYQGGWGDGYVNSVEKVYNFNPLASLSGREEYALGVQGNMWTETCNDSLELEYQLFPRLLALAETGWLASADKNWVSFYQRLQSHDEVLDVFGVNYAKHYIESADYTASETALNEAKEILEASEPGAVGYPSKEEYDKLNAAYEALVASPTDEALTTALNSAIAIYKAATITQPEAGKYYQIISASRYYKAKYAGSSMYVDGTNVRFHYTPQTEPEEAWKFDVVSDGYTMTDVVSGTKITMPSATGSNVSVSDSGTSLRVDPATKASGAYTYIPGVVNISAVANYGESTALCLWGASTGYVQASTDNAICYPGTWYIKEISDYSAWLKGLVKKATKIYDTATPGEMGQPTQEAIDFLYEKVIVPATAAANAGGVTKETYDNYIELYNEYLDMPQPSILDILSEEYYYNIRNAYFTSYYAAGTSSGTVAPRTMTSNTDAYKWQIKKNDDGTVTLFNKLNGKAAYPASEAAGANIRLGKVYNWSLSEYTVDEGNTGIQIKSVNDDNSWYTNPSSWANNVIFKPKTWGASIWEFVKTDVLSGIKEITNDAAPTQYYDLSGRRVAAPKHGVFITNKGQKVIK